MEVFESDIGCAFEKAVKLLSIRRRSEKEIKTYLSSKGYAEDVAEEAIARLKRYGYVDDAAFARAFADSYGKKYGKSYIAMRLKDLGINRQIRDNVLDYSDIDSALVCAQKYLKTRDKITREKLYNYLYNKGYSAEAINNAVKLLNESEEE